MATDALPPAFLDRHLPVSGQGRQELGKGGLLHSSLPVRRPNRLSRAWRDFVWRRKGNRILSQTGLERALQPQSLVCGDNSM